MGKDLSVVLARRLFSMAEQTAFATLSGDVNPIHMDPLAARRSVVGAPVVHGIHTLSWCLDSLAASPFRPARIGGIDVLFAKPVYLGDEVTLTLRSRADDTLKLAAMVGDRQVATITCGCRPEPLAAQSGIDGDHLPPRPSMVPEDLDLAAIPGKAGRVDFVASVADFAGAFPHAAGLIGAARLRGLAACSRLVGMTCPGLRSVFSRLTADWTDGDGAAPIVYEVVQTNARYNIVKMTVAGAGLSGKIEAFAPPRPPVQLAPATLATLIAPDEFSGQIALVVGGSRGLGELTAKLIAAGGGRVLITYAVGRDDAERIAGEIASSGGRAEVLPYDVTKPAAAQLAGLGGAMPTRMYFFATCPIFQAKVKTFDPALLQRFLVYYAYGFYDLCHALWEAGMKAGMVFYPSSVAVETRPIDLTEYAMAKAAGEILCADLPRLLPGLSVHRCRLPRLPTDQTLVVTPQELPSAVDHILPIVRQMN